MKIDPSGSGATEMYELLPRVIVPRPIASISTVSKTGVYNLAAFSYSSGICSKPPRICMDCIDRASPAALTRVRVSDGRIVDTPKL